MCSGNKNRDMDEPRIGVVICNCGGQISEKIDTDLLTEKAKELDYVTFVKQVSNLCSEKEVAELKKDIAGKVDRLLFVGCSERTSLRFSEERISMFLDEVGIDRALFEVANIREQCTWLHDDRDGATRKAIDTMRMAHARLKSDVPTLPPVKLVKKALVIGGGSAGVQAALDLANAGHKVVLVEKKPYLGGHLCQIPFLFQCEGWPSVCTSECIGPVHNRVAAYNPLISVFTNSEVLEIEKRDGNFHVKIKKGPKFVDPEKCVSCGHCAEVCPVEVENRFDFGFTKRKAIDRDFKFAVPDAYNLIESACTKCGECVNVCPTEAIDLEAKPEVVEDVFGTIILATGFKTYDLSQNEELTYASPNVVSGIEMERIIAHGFKRPSDGKKPHHIVFIMCSGSRATGDKKGKGVPYCSKTCCATTVKQVNRIVFTQPEVEVTVIYYNDIRTYERAFELFYRRAQDMLVEFINGQVTKITEKEDGNLIIQVETPEGSLDLEAGLVVLAAAQLPEGSRLVDQLRLVTDKYGFPIEFQPRILRPTESHVDRVYIAGAVSGPKIVQESVEQGSTAALKALSYLNKGEKELPKFVSVVDKEKCSRCGMCVPVCPHGAIRIDEDGATVDSAFCQGCGLCIGTCPASAIKLMNFTDKQILDQVEVAFSEIKEGEPRILALLCYWCSYAAADLAGMKGMKLPSNFRSIRIRCSASVSSDLLIEILKRGVDGILIAGCPPRNCHHVWGNEMMERRMRLTRKMINELGLESSRLRWETIGVSEWAKFAKIIKGMDEMMREIGPNPISK